MAPTATQPNKQTTRRPAARSFIARQSEPVKTMLTKLLDGFGVRVSPSLSYARITTADGSTTLGYAIPSRNHVRLDVPAKAEGSPAAKRLERGGHNRLKFDVKADADVDPARAMLHWLAS